MARKRGNGLLIGLVAGATLLAVLALTNPNQADFKEHLAARAKAGIKPGLLSGLASGAGALSSGLYARSDLVFASLWSAPGKGGSLYLGFAKKLFLKLR